MKPALMHGTEHTKLVVTILYVKLVIMFSEIQRNLLLTTGLSRIMLKTYCEQYAIINVAF
jgi:hypothetical protein